MTDRATEVAGTITPATRPDVRPYGWFGLLLSFIPIVVLAILIWVAAVLLIGVVEMPFVGVQQVAQRLANAYQSLSQLYIVRFFSLLVIGNGQKLHAAMANAAACLLYMFLAAAVLLLARFRAGSRWRDLVAWRSWNWRRHIVMFCCLLVAATVLNGVIGWLFILAQPPSAPGPSTL